MSDLSKTVGGAVRLSLSQRWCSDIKVCDQEKVEFIAVMEIFFYCPSIFSFFVGFLLLLLLFFHHHCGAFSHFIYNISRIF